VDETGALRIRLTAEKKDWSGEREKING